MSEIASALRRVTARPLVWGSLLVFHAAIALLATLPLSHKLAPLLDERPAATRLVAGEYSLGSELLQDHPELLRAAILPSLVGMALYTLGCSILIGGLLPALHDRERKWSPREVLKLLRRNTRMMLGLGLLGLVLRTLLVLLLLTLFALTARHPTSAVCALAATGALLWGTLSVVLDFASGLAIAGGGAGAFQLVRGGLIVAWRLRRTTLALLLFSLLGNALFLAVGAARLPRMGAIGIGSLALDDGLQLLGAGGRVMVALAALLVASERITKPQKRAIENEPGARA